MSHHHSLDLSHKHELGLTFTRTIIMGRSSCCVAGLKRKSKTPAANTAMDEVVAVYKAGYLAEYVWEYFRRPYWADSTALKHTEFKAWAAQHLAGHVPYLQPGLPVVWGKGG